MKAYTYMLNCADGSLYTGWTNDLEHRLKAHNAGTGSRYTRSRRPVTLAYYEEFEDKKEAMQREYAIKQLTKQQKLQLIQNQAETTDEKIRRLFDSRIESDVHLTEK